MTVSQIRIGTRGSPLALWQAHEVKRRLHDAHQHLAHDESVVITVIKTSGDRMQQGPLSEVGGKACLLRK